MELSRWASFTVRLHLFACPGCRRVQRSLDATRDALAALRDADVHDLDLQRPNER